MRRIRTPLLVTAGAVAVLGLAACAPGDGGGDVPSSSVASPSSSVSQPVAPTAVAGIAPGFDIPACEAQIEATAVQYSLGPDISFIADVTDTWEPVGPAATAALAGAEAATACLWGVPNSGRGVTIAIAELAEPTRDALIAELEGSGAFFADAEGEARVFTADGLESGDVTTAAAYVFDGAAWVSVSGGELVDAAAAREIARTVRASLAP